MAMECEIQVTAPVEHVLGCNEHHFHAAPACCSPKCECRRREEKSAVAGVTSLFPAERPNQILLELLKQADAIAELVVIARDANGRLYVTWSDQDDSAVAEASHLLAATIDAHLYCAHATDGEAALAHPILKLSFLANGELETGE